MDERHELGKKGEEIALDFLVNKGFRLVKKNYKCHRWGEIDIVMLDGEYLVFVEVRTKSNKAHGMPLETIGYSKRRQIEKMAKLYLTNENVPDSIFCRFDVVGIILSNSGNPQIEHYENAFILND